MEPVREPPEVLIADASIMTDEHKIEHFVLSPTKPFNGKRDLDTKTSTPISVS